MSLKQFEAVPSPTSPNFLNVWVFECWVLCILSKWILKQMNKEYLINWILNQINSHAIAGLCIFDALVYLVWMSITDWLTFAANTKPLAGLTRTSKMCRPAIAWILIWINIQFIKYSLFIYLNIHLLKIHHTQHLNTQAFRKLWEVGEGTASNC